MSPCGRHYISQAGRHDRKTVTRPSKECAAPARTSAGSALLDSHSPDVIILMKIIREIHGGPLPPSLLLSLAGAAKRPNRPATAAPRSRTILFDGPAPGSRLPPLAALSH